MDKRSGSRYFGWYIVFTATIITLLSTGFRMGIGPFVKPMMTDLGMSRTELSLILAVSAIVYGIGMPLAGILLKYYSTRFVLIVGVILDCVAILGTLASPGMLAFFLTYGVLLSVGLSFTSQVVLTPILSRWFIYQRGKALLYLSTGSMAGIAIMTPLETILINFLGWQQTLILMAALLTVIIIPAAIFLIKDEAPEGADGGSTKLADVSNGRELSILPEMTLRDALKTRAYWQIVIGFFVCGFSMNLMGSHAVPMLMDHNFESTTASFGVGFIGLAAILGTFSLGSVADRYSRKNILSLIYLVRGIGFLGLVIASTPLQLYIVAATAGLVWGGSAAMSSAILSDLYGTRMLGILYGWVYFGHQIGGALGSFLGGWGYETFGTHLFAFGSSTILLLGAAFVSYQLPTKETLPRIQHVKCLTQKS